MKKALVFALVAFVLSVSQAGAAAFTLTSPTIKDGGSLPVEHVFNNFGCTGKNQSPKLEWRNMPAGTQSFALTVYDPDAPTGSGWWHWVLFDIPANVTSLQLDASSVAAKALPAGAVESLTDFGAPGFGGACPPPGDKPHRYIFTLYALNVPTLGLDAKAMPAMVGFNLQGKILGKATLTGVYSR